MKTLKIIIEKHEDGYVAYPVGLSAIIIGEGDTYDDAVADLKSAIAFHIETFGRDSIEADSPEVEVFVAETSLAL